MSVDLRQSARMRTFLKGRIHYNNGASSMDCLIRDMSSTGARLELSETATLPEVFELLIPNKDARYRCVLRWRRGNGVGVVFEEAERAVGEGARPAPLAAPAADAALTVLLRRVAELESENAALRTALTAMGRIPPTVAA